MIKYAVLGLLREKRDYGYQLKRRFDARVGDVWHLNIGQVYQTLRSLENDGYILPIDDPAELAEEELQDEQYPARRLYDLTPAGSKALEQWLRQAPKRPRPVRDEMLIRLLILENGRCKEAIVRVNAQMRTYKRHLARLNLLKRNLEKESPRERLVSELGLEAALGHTEAHLKWLEYCRIRLEENESKSDRQ